MLQKLAQWVKSLDPKSRTWTAEFLGLLLLLVITYALGCEHGKNIASSPIAAVTIDSPYAYESYHIDTAINHRAFTDTSGFHVKGTKLPNGHIAFHHTSKPDSATTHTIDAEYDPLTETLSGTIEAIKIVEVPIIFHSHTISTVVPVTLTKTVAADGTSGWTWVGIGAAIGGLVTIVGLLLLHLL